MVKLKGLYRETNRFAPLMLSVLFLPVLFTSGCATGPETKASAPKAAASQPVGENLVNIRIETTMGSIDAVLFADEAPKTVDNFVKLANEKFYDGIIFHRVIPGFMVQTGDPSGTGRGGPGYKFADEFSAKLKHDKPGILSMANSGPNTNGSQFFITVAPTPWLDGKHSIFGAVTSGMDVLEKIVSAPRNSQDKPLQDIKMVQVRVAD